MPETMQKLSPVEFAALLELEDCPDGTMRGWCHQGSPLRAFGGHLAAQGFMAAARTAPPQQLPASVHLYFASAASTELPIDYLVSETRDGKSFSIRSVTGVQGGRTVLTLIAQFHRPEPGPNRQQPAELVPGPPADGSVRPMGTGSVMERAIEQHPVSTAAGDPEAGQSMRWIRSRLPVGDDAHLQAAAVVYMTDMVLPVATVQPYAATQPGVLPSASLDHAVWFHGAPRAENWLLFSAHSPVFSGTRGLAIAHIYDESGLLCATAAQDVLVRNLSR
jgi:acyl-CoA thioesterase-2